MSTNNYGKVNTNNLFVWDDISDNNGSEDLANCISFLHEDIKEVFKTQTDNDGRLFIQKTFSYYGIVWDLYFTPIVKIGYYENYYLDLIIEVGSNFAGININLITCVQETLEYSDKNKGLLIAKKNYLVKKLKEVSDIIILEIENIFRKNAKEYRIIAKCDNGEQFLEKVL